MSQRHRFLLFATAASSRSTSSSSSLSKFTPTLQSTCRQPIKNYTAQKERNDDDDDREIVEKARTTAEEFSRVAKVKAEALKRSQTTDAAFEGITAQVGESEYVAPKQKIKETVDNVPKEKSKA
ncbi:hypothetical protein Scep_028828 [Stephania cephalantha]|uniref:Uncharacterized protein n=1 Tax=Stephania cephalantha TaxID=152367 RepID=A0AAP0HMG2_9MAGN